MLIVDGEASIEATIELPRSGAWTIDAGLASDVELTGKVQVNIDDKYTMLGTVVRTGQWQNIEHVRIVGGAGGLSNIAKPQHYTAATVGVVLGDLLRQAGETLSPTSDAATLAARVKSWTTNAIPTGTLIARLLETAAPATTWRVLLDGTVWVGSETWPDCGLIEDTDYSVLSRDTVNLTATLGVETPRLLPGTTIGGNKVARVQHLLGSPTTRTIATFEGSKPAGVDRMRAAMAGFVKNVNPVDYSAMCWATVIQQRGNTIDVQPIDAGKASMAGVKLYGGIPGWSLQLKRDTAPGGHVLVGWGNNDPRQAFVIGFSSDVQAEWVQVEMEDAVTLAAPHVTLNSPDAKIGAPSAPYELMAKWETYRQAEALLNDSSTGMAAVFQAMANACTGPLAPLGAGFAALAGLLAAFEAQAPTFTSQTASNS